MSERLCQMQLKKDTYQWFGECSTLTENEFRKYLQRRKLSAEDADSL